MLDCSPCRFLYRPPSTRLFKHLVSDGVYVRPSVNVMNEWEGTISVEQPVLFCSMKAPTGSSWLESSTLSVPQMSALVSSSRKERFLEFSVSGILLQSSTMSSAKARTVSVSNIHAVIDLGYYQLFDSLISQFRNRWKLLSSQNVSVQVFPNLYRPLC